MEKQCSLSNLQPVVERVDDGRPLVIAGPCSGESREQVLATAEGVAAAGVEVFRAGLWKPRTLPGAFEGVGAAGLPWLAEAKARYGLTPAVEVATRAHVEAAVAEGVEVLWIGARTSTNPFAVQEIADTIAAVGKDVAVLVKNPVNPDLELWIGAIQRIYNAGVRRLAAVLRGFSSYGQTVYRNEPIWRIALELGRRLPELPLICDPSHIGGRRDLVAPLSQQALDMGYDGLMIECHVAPDAALSDSGQQITPDELSRLLQTLTVDRAEGATETLAMMRGEIDSIDDELFDILGRRMELSREIARYKQANRMSVVQKDRYDEIMRTRVAKALSLGLDEAFARRLMAAIHEESVRQQLGSRIENS